MTALVKCWVYLAGASIPAWVRTTDLIGTGERPYVSFTPGEPPVFWQFERSSLSLDGPEGQDHASSG